MHYLIIGVDPGHTIGLAALDLSGKPLKAIHIQQGGFEAALAALESWGTPSLIASDVRPAPELVLRLASAFNAALFVPERPWREEDKKRAVREAFEHFSFPVENVHERDALSAAVQAWRHHQNLLRQSSGLELSEADLESLRHLLLQGFRQSIALEMLKKAKEPKQSEPEILPHAQLPRAESVPSTPAISLTTERVISELKKRITFLEAEREQSAHKMRLLENGFTERQRRDNTIRKMAGEIMRLRESLVRVNAQKTKQRMASNKQRAANNQGPRNPKQANFDSKSSPARPSPPPDNGDLNKLEANALENVINEYRRTRSKPGNSAR